MKLLKSIDIKKGKMAGGITIFLKPILRISMVDSSLEKSLLETILIPIIQRDSKKFVELTVLLDS